jgi:hypothetical protein
MPVSIERTGDVGMPSPIYQVYDMSDRDAQELVFGLLRQVDDVAVSPAANGPDHYVVVECGDSARARSIFTLVTSIDPGATLIHTTTGEAPDFVRPLELDLD